MSGGIQENFIIANMRTEKQKNIMWDIFVKSRQHKSLIGVSINAKPNAREARLSNGLIMGHAYTVTKIACLERFGREIRLVRVRNPWGNENEWRGPWADRSNDWYSVSTDVKRQLLFEDKPEGEFWMSFDDFYRNFEVVEICNLTPEAFADELQGKHPNLNLKWNMISYNGEWIVGRTSGGCGQYDKSLYWTNPQFLISLTDVDPTDNENMATLIISLMQKNTREKRFKTNGEPAEEAIQFRLYRVKNKDDAMKAKSSGLRLYANQLEPAGTSGPYTNLRDLTKRFRLPPGDYVIMPSCYESNVEGSFLVRIFTEQDFDGDSYRDLSQHKGRLATDDIKFFDVNREKLFGSWNGLFNSDRPRNEWKSSLTSTVIRSRSMFYSFSPYKDTVESIYSLNLNKSGGRLDRKKND